jgi:hypothetical protein
MSTQPVNLVTSNVPPSGVELKSDAVKLIGLDGRLFQFLTTCGLVHLHCFDKPLIVTCAVDSIEHKVGKHPIGKAIDLRVSDLDPRWQDRFLLIVCTLCDRYGCTVFDERNLPGAQHFHVEVAG